jgi:shikimate dehydrogenase
VAGRKAAVLGSPIAHSLSPVLHRAAYAELGLADWSYEAIECDASGLPGLLDSLGPQWAGLSLTMPLKRAVLPLLDVAEPLVDHVGVANTVVFADGARRGYNTDVPGIGAALCQAQAGAAAQVRDDHALPGNERAVGIPRGTLILGGGATACSALAAVWASDAAPTVVAVRDEANAGPLAEVAGRLGAEVRLTRFGADLPWRRWRLVISTVPAGAADKIADQVYSGALAADTVLDVVYHPWPTRLAAAAERAGSRVISGFELLLHQAALQVKLMTGVDAPTAAMRAAGQAELARRQLAC